ncbi:MAG: hypothetical protein ACFFFO_07150 [Candidatus Thorarchaeota archaeon]
MSKDSSVPDIDLDNCQYCIVVMIAITIFTGYLSLGVSWDPFPFAVALGLATVAASILYLARSMQTNKG